MKLTLLNKNSVPKNKKSEVYEPKILNEARFYDFFKQANTAKKAHIYDKKLIMKELKRVRCQILKATTFSTFYTLSKMMRQQVESMHVDMISINNIKEMIKNDRKCRIVYIPVYKSY